MTELDEQLPFEREVYISMLIKHLEEEKQRNEQRKLKS
jgi:hypothetical protein